jgi:hypothetical protein
VGAILDLAERSWQSELADKILGLMAPSFETEEIASGIVFMQGFANVSAV